MFYFPPTIILRHSRENLKKCSLRGLEKRGDLVFLTYPKASLPNLENYCLLTLNAPPLSAEDRHCGLFLIDGTWRYAQKMLNSLPLIKKRRLPNPPPTAYPRKQTGCPDPSQGLASVEALYIAYLLLGRETEGLLDSYYWKDRFLSNMTPNTIMGSESH